MPSLNCLQVGKRLAEDPPHPAVQPPMFLCLILSNTLPILEGVSPTQALEVELSNPSIFRTVTAFLCLPALPWVMGVET